MGGGQNTVRQDLAGHQLMQGGARVSAPEPRKRLRGGSGGGIPPGENSFEFRTQKTLKSLVFLCIWGPIISQYHLETPIFGAVGVASPYTALGSRGFTISADGR